MPFVTSFERLGRQEGRQEGRQQALHESTLELLQTQFKEVPYPVRERLQVLTDEPTLKRLLREAALAPDLATFTKATQPP